MIRGIIFRKKGCRRADVAVCVKFAKGKVHSVQVLTPDNKNVELLKTTDTESRTEKIDYSVSRSTNTTKNSHINSASSTMVSQPTFDVNSNFPLIPKESQAGEVTPVEVDNENDQPRKYDFTADETPVSEKFNRILEAVANALIKKANSTIDKAKSMHPVEKHTDLEEILMCHYKHWYHELREDVESFHKG